MDDICDMNDSQKEVFRKKLLVLLDDLNRQNDRGQDGQQTVTLDQQSVGRLSRMDALQQQAMAKATQARRNQMKTRINAALARLKDDEFGYCLSCGDEIAENRLTFDPTVPTCLTCASGG